MTYTDRTALPPGWRIEAIPADWDPDNPKRIKAVRVDYGITETSLPERFYLSIQTEDMQQLPEATAVLVELETTRSGPTVVAIFGVGTRWLSCVEEVVAGVAPDRWVDEAVGRAVAFMSKPGVLTALNPFIKELSIPKRDQGAASTSAGDDGGVRRRRDITPEHLAEVAAVYEAAEGSGAPTRAVQTKFEVSHSTAAKWVGKARDVGVLPPAPKRGSDS